MGTLASAGGRKEGEGGHSRSVGMPRKAGRWFEKAPLTTDHNWPLGCDQINAKESAMHKSGWFQFFSSFQFPSNLNDPKFNISVFQKEISQVFNISVFNISQNPSFHSISQEEGKLPGHQRWPATYRQVELRHCHCCTRLPPEGTTGKKPTACRQHPPTSYLGLEFKM